MWFLPAIVRLLGYAPWTTDGSIGDRLLAYRRERGLPQSAFAGLLGVDPGTLSRWERGLRVPTGTYERLAQVWLEKHLPDSPLATATGVHQTG